MFAQALTTKPKKVNPITITVQASDSGYTAAAFDNSVKIIKDRLAQFSTEKFDMEVLKEKKQIKITFNDKWNLRLALNLMTQKGALGFYETLDRPQLKEILKNHPKLAEALSISNPEVVNARLGCLSVPEAIKTEEYLYSSGLQKMYTFGWQQDFKNSKACLYALKSDTDHNNSIKENEIESVKTEFQKEYKNYSVMINLKNEAVKKWSDITRRSINQMVVIMMDNTVLSAPIVRGPIDGGKCIITGDFTEEDVNFIAALGNHSALPLNFQPVKP